MQALWDRLATSVDAFEAGRPRRVLERVRDTGLDPSLPFPELTREAHEAISRETNEELRQVLTAIQHRIQLNLASSSRPALTSEEGREILEALQEASDLLDAQLLPEDIAQGFLVLDRSPIELSETIRFHLRRRELPESLETSFEAVPVEADPWRSGEAFLELLEPFLADPVAHRPVVSVRWDGEDAVVFLGARPPLAPVHRIQDWLDQAPRVGGGQLDIPMACTVLQRQGAEITVHERDDGAAGFLCVLPALEQGPLVGGT